MNARSQRFVSSSWCLPGILVALLSASSLAIPVQSQEPRTTVREAMTVAGTVDRIDQLSRALTLRTSAGAAYTINVAPELTLFDELKRGETLTVRVDESVIVAVRPDVKPSIAVDTTASANQRERENAEVVTRIDLSADAPSLCLAQTGANPVRPHMMAINPAQTHAIISFVASGHVLFMDANRREPVACFRMSVGAGGAQQAHMSTPSPDGTYVTVANQNGKLFERIQTDYATNSFVHDTAATVNLATCTTPNGVSCEAAGVRPDNAPICPITESSSRFTFVTLRGGGLFVVDSTATPMQIVGEYDTSMVHGNGCLGAEVTRQDVH